MTGSIVRARAPLRLGLGGGGTDTSPYAETYGGVVLNTTIDLYAHVTIARRSDGCVRLRLADRNQEWCGRAELPLNVGEPLNLLRGVYDRMCRDFNAGAPLDIDIVVDADVPPGSGLGTSSAMVVALVQAFSELLQARIPPYDVARLAFEIERIDLKLNGGKQDQYAAAFGGLNLIEFGPGQDVLVNTLRISPEVAAEFEASLVLFFSGVSRDSARIIDEQTRNISNGEANSVEAMHELKSIAIQMKHAILRGNIPEVAAILDESWKQKKRIASTVTTPELDAVYDVAMAAGALGGKVSGAGGGGFMMFLVDPQHRQDVLRALEHRPGRVFMSGLTTQGVMAWRAARTTMSVTGCVP
jgi:D-glycero-alpha-D-manno-heptose-7-phosphate kinase